MAFLFPIHCRTNEQKNEQKRGKKEKNDTITTHD